MIFWIWMYLNEVFSIWFSHHAEGSASGQVSGDSSSARGSTGSIHNSTSVALFIIACRQFLSWAHLWLTDGFGDADVTSDAEMSFLLSLVAWLFVQSWARIAASGAAWNWLRIGYLSTLRAHWPSDWRSGSCNIGCSLSNWESASNGGITERGSRGRSQSWHHTLLSGGFSFNKILLSILDKFLFDATIESHSSEDEGWEDSEFKWDFHELLMSWEVILFWKKLIFMGIYR
jgi:hypothetical protein